MKKINNTIRRPSAKLKPSQLLWGKSLAGLCMGAVFFIFLFAIVSLSTALANSNQDKNRSSGAVSYPSYSDEVRAIIGESSNQGYRGMLAVACGIRNRGTLKGVYGLKAKHVDKQPEWVWQQAQKAWEESEHNRIHSGTHWGSTIIDKKWIKKMEQNNFVKVYSYKDHVFYREK